jgi:NTP pyrophosphatase (non-canonical NTP hydrolase)
MSSHPILKSDPTLPDIQDYIRQVLKHRGFDKQTVDHEFRMLVEEVGELAKALRKPKGGLIAEDSEDRELAHEAADVLWMLVSVCNRSGIDLEKALRDKEEHNKTRTWN